MREYISLTTGEIVTGITAVIKTIWQDFKHYKFINLRWKKF